MPSVRLRCLTSVFALVYIQRAACLTGIQAILVTVSKYNSMGPCGTMIQTRNAFPAVPLSHNLHFLAGRGRSVSARETSQNTPQSTFTGTSNYCIPLDHNQPLHYID